MMDSESRSKSEIGAHEVYHGAKSFHTFLNAFLLTYREKKGKLDARLTKLKLAGITNYKINHVWIFCSLWKAFVF